VAAVDLSLTRPGGEPGWPADPGPVVLDTGRGYSLWVFDAGLACCAVECAAALSRDRPAGPPASAPEHPGMRANVLIVAGTVTDKLAPLVLAAYQRVPDPKFVLSFGACSNSGGPYWDSYCVTKGVDQMIPVDVYVPGCPYWDSYCVTKGVDQMIPVDVYVPGCPPRPEALLDGLDVLVRRGPGDS